MATPDKHKYSLFMDHDLYEAFRKKAFEAKTDMQPWVQKAVRLGSKAALNDSVSLQSTEDQELAADVLIAYHGGNTLLRKEIESLLTGISKWKKDQAKTKAGKKTEVQHEDSPEERKPGAVAGGRRR